MQLTNELLATYEGGQMEMRNTVEGTHYRGEIAKAEVINGGTLFLVDFKWLARSEGESPSWVNEETHNALQYGSDLGFYAETAQIDDNRVITLEPWKVAGTTPMGSYITIYPPDGDKLDPSNVRGWKLAPRWASKV